jgi:hypothetical protein
MDPLQQLFFPPAELLSQGLEGGAGEKKVSLNEADQFFIFHGKLHRKGKSFKGFFKWIFMIYNIDLKLESTYSPTWSKKP